MTRARTTSLLLYSVTLSSLLLLEAMQAQRTLAGSPDGTTSTPTFRKIENKAFEVGEELTFDVGYGFITAGEAKMAVPRWSWQNGRKCYNIEFTVRSTNFFDKLYRVRDRYESHIDADGLFSWKFVQQIREGGYKRDFAATFDQTRLKAATTEGEYPIEPFTQDILSAFYFMRTYDYSAFKPGQKVYLKNFYKDSTYLLTVKYLGKQTIDVEAGTFRTILLEPIMKEGGLFKASGRIIVWLTDDERKIPVQVEAEIPIGSITSELTAYKGINGPIRARVK